MFLSLFFYSYWTLRCSHASESVINVVLFGTLGCGKSSIINILANEPIAQVSTDVDHCTKRPQWHQLPIGKSRFRLWDTMGFRLASGGDTNLLSPYEQAHAVLQHLTDGVHLILLCARKDEIDASLGGLYRLINDFLYGGRAPIALVVTQCDTPDDGWWDRSQDAITEKTGIPVHSIPHAFITTIQSGCVRSKQVLEALLENYATTVAPIPLRLDLSSSKAASLRLASHSGLGIPKAKALVEQFSKPLRPFNVIFCGEEGVGKSSIINLLIGDPVAETNSRINSCTSDFRSYKINTGMRQFLIWDTLGFCDPFIDRRKVAENAVGLIHEVSRQGGVDLLVFCKRAERLHPSEVENYRLFQEFLCEGQVPVAVIVTHLDFLDPMERWWELNGEDLVWAMGKDVIGHACITSLPFHDLHDLEHHKKLLDSRLSVQAMLEECISSRNTLAGVEGITSRQSPKRTGKMTITSLMDRCGFTERQAEALIQLYYDD